jgi:2,2-dialkylglycine decarboxylase (pyruvate)
MKISPRSSAEDRKAIHGAIRAMLSHSRRCCPSAWNEDGPRFGEGTWVETADGRRVLDFTSGQICSTLGHNHPRIAEAVRETLDRVVHLNSWMLSEPILALAERLTSLLPPPLDKVILLTTGSEANARGARGRARRGTGEARALRADVLAALSGAT